ncbi:type VI secretion system accessory protein TagJ [Bordetella genomosp. 13]|uniref:type VI secretion system accessory protein TagJ n=1 Tax=Bordetella genomosp. 13 TaxID=463040 RepID=UPI0011A8A41E|nr:type VI secretion system accessory protein TagJ [Bordetella genomosp. 13]
MQNSVLSLRDGSLSQHLEAIESRIRRAPDDADLRAQLFQLAAVQGDWKRAADQLRLCSQFSMQSRPMAMMYTQAIEGEKQREQVLAGNGAPVFFASHPEWCDLMVQALHADAAEPEKAAGLRAQALEAAQVSAGALTGAADEAAPEPYAWIGDGDSRLGPVCELITAGQYGWVPFEDISEIALLAPEGLCDVVWARAEILLADGRTLPGLIPARYPAAPGERMADQEEHLRLGRVTQWRELADGTYAGAGQKMWITDAGEFALLDVRGLRQEAA